MDVDWAESHVPSAELRLAAERAVGVPPRLALASEFGTAPIQDRRTTSGSPTDLGEQEFVGLCSDAACVRARREAEDAHVVRVELDADALADALAKALVAALDGRLVANPAITPGVAVASPVVAPKRSFWAGAWHADVVLSAIAIVVVVVVLLAWTV